MLYECTDHDYHFRGQLRVCIADYSFSILVKLWLHFYVFIVIFYNFIQSTYTISSEIQNIIKCVLQRPVNDASRSMVAIAVTLIRYIKKP